MAESAEHSSNSPRTLKFGRKDDRLSIDDAFRRRRAASNQGGPFDGVHKMCIYYGDPLHHMS